MGPVDGSIMGWRWGYPPVWTDTDACQNITFRRTLYTGGKNLPCRRRNDLVPIPPPAGEGVASFLLRPSY